MIVWSFGSAENGKPPEERKGIEPPRPPWWGLVEEPTVVEAVVKETPRRPHLVVV